MLDFQDEMSQREKCYTTLGQLPVFVDPKHLPQKKPPFSTIIGHPLVHTTELILSEELYHAARSSIESITDLKYAKGIS